VNARHIPVGKIPGFMRTQFGGGIAYATFGLDLGRYAEQNREGH
jgi:hypothetical protein